MKKIRVIVLFLLYGSTGFAQNTFPTPSGNVGIGISNPQEILHIKENQAVLKLSSSSYYGGSGQHMNQTLTSIKFNNYNSGNTNLDYSSEIRGVITNGWANSVGLAFVSQGNEAMRIRSNGHIGIGTTLPEEILHIQENEATIRLSTNTYFGESGQDLDQIIGTLKFNNFNPGNTNLDYSSEIRGILTNGWATSVGLSFVCGNDEKMRINSNGNVGIGTTSTGSHRLAVEGSIGAREIKVEATGWSDFVFENNFELRTLEEVEQHIAEKGHLPEIPSEAEVTENGINLGEMDAKLLQKIEELTLYVIDMNKQLKSQSERVEQLELENSDLKEKINSLENK